MNFFLRRYEQLGESFDPLDFQLRRSLRVNTLKISECDLVKRLKAKGVKLEKIPFLKDGYWYESEFSLGSTNEYLQGYYYLQEAASQLSVQVLNPKSGEYVLDMSAAPGGKTSQIASFMENKGLIVAADANVLRLDSLSNNLERLGVKIALIYKKDTRYIDDFGLKFDKILLDAPCSGNFAEDKDWFESISKKSDLFIFTIRLEETDNLIGTCQLQRINFIDSNAELQIRIGESKGRGKGYGTQAVRHLLDFAFRQLNLHRVYLHVFKAYYYK